MISFWKDIDALNWTSSLATMHKFLFWNLKKKYKDFVPYFGLEFGESVVHHSHEFSVVCHVLEWFDNFSHGLKVLWKYKAKNFLTLLHLSLPPYFFFFTIYLLLFWIIPMVDLTLEIIDFKFQNNNWPLQSLSLILSIIWLIQVLMV